VIVVTHLPQIASFADRHVRVTKRDGVAALEVLEGDGRVEEIARMLSGSVDSDTAASHARELLDVARAHAPT
jgi:DNA repair protein RecN (Recombination protein N)